MNHSQHSTDIVGCVALDQVFVNTSTTNNATAAQWSKTDCHEGLKGDWQHVCVRKTRCCI